jgi:adenylate cyclase
MGKRIPFLMGFILLAFAIWMQTTAIESLHSFIARLNNLSYDTQLRARLFTHPVPPQSPIVIVDIDDKSLEKEGRWPWSRSTLARLINQLQADGAVVIALDIMFSEKENNIVDLLLTKLRQEKLNTPQINALFSRILPTFDEDSTLAKSFIGKDIVLGMTFLMQPQVTGTLPPPILTLTTPEEKNLSFIHTQGFISNIALIQNSAKNAGFINAYADQDGIIRRAPILVRYQDNLYPSLALKAVQLYLLGNIKLITAPYNNTVQLEAVQLADHLIPTDAQAEVFIPYRGKAYTFTYYSATDVLHEKIPENALAGKVVFVGTSATGVGDLRATAIQAVFPGIEIQATIANGILENNFSYRPAWTSGAEIAITTLLGLMLILLFPYLGPRALSLCILILPLCLIFLNNWLWEKTGLILFVFIPILLTIILAVMNMIYGYLFETRRRERLKEMFGQYVPEKHIDEMLKASGSYGLYGEDREMTVLFADIRNFTSISEPMSATELKDMLNQFFTPMTEIIFTHHGTIDKYIGDLIMAFWGAPLKDAKHAEHAIGAALDMQIAVEQLKPIFKEKGWAEVNIGIGLNSGIMSVGDMGSQFRRNYTVLGDAVNLGSRVEGLTKYYGVKIMVTEVTQNKQKDFIFRQLDRVRVKGKKTGIAIYEVIGRHEELTPALSEELELSQRALNLYFIQQWDEALHLFEQLHEAYPAVKLYHLYIDRINEFKLNPPDITWDGIYAHANK